MHNMTERCDKLFAMHMKFVGDSYVGKEEYNRDFNVDMIEIKCDSDEEWATKMADMNAELLRRMEDL